MIVVVSDTSPLRALHHLGLSSVLGRLFDRVVIPPAVRNELTSPTRRLPGVDLSELEFVEVRAPQDTARVRRFLESLDPGESEALSLALELPADAILIDELAGRKAAAQNGIRTLGTLGILLDTKSRGLVQEVRPLVERLEDELGFFISDALRQRILDLAGE